jgi:hypothetical protein
MSWYSKVKYDCRHTTYRIEKQQNARLSIYDTIALYTHLVTCPFCKLYKKQTKIIKQLLYNAFSTSDAIRLDEAHKIRIQQMIEDRLQ